MASVCLFGEINKKKCVSMDFARKAEVQEISFVSLMLSNIDSIVVLTEFDDSIMLLFY